MNSTTMTTAATEPPLNPRLFDREDPCCCATLLVGAGGGALFVLVRDGCGRCGAMGGAFVCESCIITAGAAVAA